MGKIKVYEYHSQPLEEIEFPDGTVWKLRQPLEADYFRAREVIAAWEKRVNERGKALAARAVERAEAEQERLRAEEKMTLWREEERERLKADTAPEKLEAAVEKAVEKRIRDAGDEVGRALVEKEGAEDEQPLDCTPRYLIASLVAIYITPTQTPETLLEKLGPDILHMLNARVGEVLGGGAAKKRIARES